MDSLRSLGDTHMDAVPFYDESRGLTREQVGRALILGIDGVFLEKIAARRKQAMIHLSVFRSKDTKEIAQILSFGRPSTDPATLSLKKAAEKAKITYPIEDFFGESDSDFPLALLPFYAASIEEARLVQEVILLINISHRYRLFIGKIPTFDKTTEKSKLGEYSWFVQSHTHIQDIPPQKFDYLLPRISGKDMESTLSLDLSTADSFNYLGTIRFLDQAGYLEGVSWLTEILILGGWVVKDRRFPDIQKEVLDRFYLKYHEYIDDTNSEIGTMFQILARGYTPNETIRKSIRMLGATEIRKPIKPSRPRLPNTATQIQTILSDTAISITNLSHKGFSLKDYSAGGVVMIECQHDGAIIFRSILPLENGTLSLSELSLDEQKDYAMIVSLPEGISGYSISNPLLRLESPIRKYAKETLPQIPSRIQNTTIRNKQTIEAKAFIDNWSYPNILRLGIRKKGENNFWVISPETLIDISSFTPGEYELSFLMPSHEQGYESITKKGLPVFTVKLEVSYTIATSPQKPVPQKTLIRESSVLDDPEEEWILSLAILLEEKNPHNVVMIKEGDNYILSGTIDTIPFNLFIAEDLSIIRDGSEIVGIHKDLIISGVQEKILQYESIGKEKVSENIRKKLIGIGKHISRIYRNLIVNREELSAGIDIGELIHASRIPAGFRGVNILNPGMSDIRTAFEHIEGEYRVSLGKIDGPTKELRIDLIESALGISIGHIISDPGSMSYVFESSIESGKGRDKVFTLLSTLLTLIGQIGSGSVKKKTNKNQKYPTFLTNDEVKEAILGSKNIRTQGMMERNNGAEGGRNTLREAYERFQNGKGKIVTQEGYSSMSGLYIAEISSKKGIDALLSLENEEYADIGIILTDEKISATGSDRSGNTRIYEIIRSSPRLQKYLLHRCVATITKKVFRGKSPFENGMKEIFDTFWQNIDDENKEIFLNYFGEYGEGTDGALMHTIGYTRFIDMLIARWEEKKVQMIYSRPQVIPLDEFMALIEIMKQSEKTTKELLSA